MTVTKIGLLLAGAFSLLGVRAADAPAAPWYDREMVHNAVHELEEDLEKFAPRLVQTDTETLRTALAAYRKAVDHLHTEMSDYDKEQSAEIIMKAFQTTLVPYQQFLAAIRGNQLKHKERLRYASDALDAVYLQGQVAFWLTPSAD